MLISILRGCNPLLNDDQELKTGAAIGAAVLLPDASICGIDVSILDFRYTIPRFTIGFMAGRRDFALVAPQSRNFHQPARRYQRRTRVFTFDIWNTSISPVTPRFRMNLSALSRAVSFNDIDVMFRERAFLETLRLEFTKRILGKIADEKLRSCNVNEHLITRDK